MARKEAKAKKGKTGSRSRLAAKKAGKKKTTRKTAKKTKGVKARKPKRVLLGKEGPGELVAYGQRGLGARSGGQAGDTQGLRAAPDADAESVEELLEEGQSFEAEVLNGIERASDADEGEVRTHEVPEDDVPDEYREKD
jgi:hypothetical protein